MTQTDALAMIELTAATLLPALQKLGVETGIPASP
jgi:hypothetical protein